MRKLFLFVLQFTTVGLAIAFVIIAIKPDLIGMDKGNNKIVNTHEAPVRVQNPDNPLLGKTSYADAVSNAAPAVVNIYATQLVSKRRHPFLDDPMFRHFFGDQFERREQQRSTPSLGSGVIVSPQGYILTNNHVVAHAQDIFIALMDGRSAKATVVGTDPESDLAVLKITLSELPVISLGQSQSMRVGDVVLAIGNPFGVGQTVTSGIISAMGRNTLGINTFENFIQTDAAINPGNSGGALINAYGDLIGINTAIFSQSGGSQGIGFAIPISLARDVMTQLIEQGHVIRGWLGVAIQDITPELAESFKLDSTNGVIINNIILNGPADRAGLDRGDIITHINGKPVRDFRETLDKISMQKPGKEIVLDIIRQGKPRQLKATVIERPVQQP